MPPDTTDRAVQDFYPDDFAHCYGCGRLNHRGLHVRTSWDGEEAVSRYTPRTWETAVPGFVYGGLIASLIDCHAMGTAAAATLQAAGQEVGAVPSPRFVTAALRVDYLRPTPLGPELVIRSRVRQATERKVVIDATLSVENVVTARAEAVAVRMPPTMA
jgi:acyl-coenzyme A thioesterase PaaI-like protein